MSVYVVLVNWQGAADTIACLESIGRLNGPSPKVIVCDNASADDSWTRLETYVADHDVLDIQLVQSGKNLGFAGGNNVGLRLAMLDPEADYVWLLNNDTEVHPDALNMLVSHMKDRPEVGICGSTLLYANDRSLIQAVGGRYNAWFGKSEHMLGHQPYSAKLCRTVNAAEMDYVVGASMFVRRVVLDTIGLLKEDYFLYCEEIDLATRMRRMLPQLTLGYAPESLVYHKEGASTGAGESDGKTYRYFSDYFFITSRLKFARTYYPWRSFIVQALMLIVALNRLKRRQLKSALVAMCCFCGLIPRFLDPRGRTS